jgi:GntR family transcriptional regulator
MGKVAPLFSGGWRRGPTAQYYITMGIDKGAGDPEHGAEAGRAAIRFRLDPASGVPAYLQVVQQVQQALRLGYLRQGDQLPRVKDVVAELAINPNTVLKAYKELEHLGIASGHPGLGTFVDGTPGTVGLPELDRLRQQLVAWLRSAQAAGLDEQTTNALFATATREFYVRPTAPRSRRRGRGGVVA